MIYEKRFQDIFAPAGYFKSLRFYDRYLSECKFLPRINNEIASEFSEHYKKRMTDLPFLVAVKFLKDTTVIPRESEHFGYFKDETQKE